MKIYKKKALLKNDQAILKKNFWGKENSRDRFTRMIICGKNEYTERLT